MRLIKHILRLFSRGVVRSAYFVGHSRHHVPRTTQYAFIAVLALCASYSFLTDRVTSAEPPGDGWIACAAEGEFCNTSTGTVPQRVTVRFGNVDGYSYLENVTSGVTLSLIHI